MNHTPHMGCSEWTTIHRVMPVSPSIRPQPVLGVRKNRRRHFRFAISGMLMERS
jgi:hypothetical protein